MMSLKKTFCAALAAASLSLAPQTQAAEIVLLIGDDPSDPQGFFDPTPVAPVGGNPGTTLGDQRIFVFLVAAQVWGAQIESDIPIYIGASFRPLACSPAGGTLGSAGPSTFFRDYPGAPLDSTFYVTALADAQFGADLIELVFGLPQFPDIFTNFNSDIGVNPDCLTGQSWYNGFDADNDPATEIDLLTVVMHELSHGLGFLEGVNEFTGELLAGFPDAYSRNMFDNTLGDTWDNLTNEERLFSQTNTGNLVWVGPSVTDEAPNNLGPRPSVRVLNNSSGLKGVYEAQAASFGAPLREDGGLTGKMRVVDDGTDVATDGCEPISTKLNGKIALIDRGGCAFVTKVQNAQDAGAKGAIVVNNVAAGLPNMGGFSDTITIPSVGVTQADGEAFKAAAQRNIVGRLYIDAEFLAGADPDGNVRLYAPSVVSPGSSKSHFDIGATPNLLMEPFINDDLDPTVDLDLTKALLEDIGWIVN